MADHNLKSRTSGYSVVLGKEVLYRDAKLSTDCFYCPKKREAGSLCESSKRLGGSVEEGSWEA